jgi:hypothetical protein
LRKKVELWRLESAGGKLRIAALEREVALLRAYRAPPTELNYRDGFLAAVAIKDSAARARSQP